MKVNKINIILSTLNFVLCFVGYQLVTTLLLPVTSNVEGVSRMVTIPYRAFALILSIIVILLNVRKPIGKLPFALDLFLFFWVLLIIRMFYDIYIRADITINVSSQLWLYVFGICLPAVFSILQSYRNIDLEKALQWILGLIAFAIFITLLSNKAILVRTSEFKGRQDANIALNTITFGHLGTTGIILSLYLILKGNFSWLSKILASCFMLVSAFTMLRAGSQGPIFSLIFVLIFWLGANAKNIWKGLFTVVVACILLFMFLDQILELMGKISTVIETRLRFSIYKGDTSNRDVLFRDAISAFLDSPILGKQFALLDKNGTFYYSHNIILDSFMGLGVIGGGAMIFFLVAAIKKSYFLIRCNDTHYWIGLILVQQVMSNMVSGAFYYNQLLSALLTFLFLYYQQQSKVRKYIST